jgi:hypothetical protein
MSESWRANVAAAATLGAVLGALPGALVMSQASLVVPPVVAGPALLAGSAIFASLLAAWTANLGLERGRSRLAPLLLTGLGAGALVALVWVALVASGLWSATFPFPPYFGILGFSLLVGGAVGFVAMARRDTLDWDGVDVIVSLGWAAVPPALILLSVRLAGQA